MSNKSAVVIFFVLLFAATGLVSCGGSNADSHNAPNTPNNPNVPTVTLSASSTSIAYNATTTISWKSTNTTSCSSTGGGGTGTSGSFTAGPLTATASYTVTCSSTGGSASKSITITVAPSAITSVSSPDGAGHVTFTSANNLTTGAIITISGTTHHDGTYTIISATGTTFVVSISPQTYAAETFASASWQLAGGMVSGCATTGAGASAINLSIVPSRFTGVCPLSVFFDASSTTATAANTKPFHDLEYRWNFGDAAGSIRGTTWTTGSRVSSRNAATGAVAGHVYENPGPHTVTLTVTDGTNTVSNSCALIVVQNPDAVFAGTNTICIGANSTPLAGNGCPADALKVVKPDFPTAISTYANPGKRVLFQRGDTFTAATSAVLTSTGPGILGAFGSSTAAPIVQMTGNTSLLVLSSRETPNLKDWRIMDLEFDGLNTDTNSVGIDALGGFNQVLILRMGISHMATGIAFADSNLSLWYTSDHITHPMWDETAIVDSTITPRFNAPDGWEIFASANHGSIQGNVLGNMLNNSSMGSHVVRVPYMEKGVIANNTIARPGASQLAIKLHSQAWCQQDSPDGTCISYDNDTPPPVYNYLNNKRPIGIFSTLSGYTEKVIIADNKIIGADNPYTMSVAAENLQSDERLRDIIIERNLFVSGAGTWLDILSTASDITIRNNIADMTQAKYKTFVNVFDPGTTPPSNNVKVLNNTIYAVLAEAGGEFHGVEIHPTATNVSVVNNLISASAALDPRMLVSGTGASGLVESNNILGSSPASLFTIANPVNPVDFSPNATSPARGAGLLTVPVHSDFFLTVRPLGSMDIGAVEVP